MSQLLLYLLPWEFSPTVFLASVLSAVFYLRGMRILARAGQSVGFFRPLSFFLGLILMYGALQTYFDYLSQHMFWVHRLQHLVLHHVAPVLLVLATPGAALSCGMPAAMRERGARLYGSQRWLQRIVRVVQGPVVAPLLFVGLIFFWLTPSIHFTAMLDADRYRAMNWSMAIDGILFWWLILTPRTAQGKTALSYPLRALIVVGVTVPQILLGAHLTLHKTPLFDVYGICGRAWAITPMDDQQLGGLLTWIPPAMMTGIALLLVLRMLLNEARQDQERENRRESAGRPAASALLLAASPEPTR